MLPEVNCPKRRSSDKGKKKGGDEKMRKRAGESVKRIALAKGHGSGHEPIRT